QQPSRILPSDKDSDAAGRSRRRRRRGGRGDAELRNARNTTNGDERCTTNDDDRERCEPSGKNAKLRRRWRCGGDQREM
ncbi:hypothetical protein PIB30_071903, partial [Stylosanthes scabra]|nr:hypothetical protein [Stylosanthes scabra]